MLDFTFLWAELLEQYLAIFSILAQVASKLSDKYLVFKSLEIFLHKFCFESMLFYILLLTYLTVKLNHV